MYAGTFSRSSGLIIIRDLFGEHTRVVRYVVLALVRPLQ